MRAVTRPQHVSSGSGATPERYRTAPQPSALTWPVPMLPLMTLLALAEPAEVRQGLAELRREPRAQGTALLNRLHPLVVLTVHGAAQALAEAIGADLAAVLRFCDPHSLAALVRGERGQLRRLDRIWGGPALLAVEATHALQLRWPGPMPGCALVLHGSAEAAGVEDNATALALPIAAVLRLEPGAVVLVRRAVVGTLLEAARDAGLFVPKIITDACGEVSSVNTVAGDLVLAGMVATINHRRVRLTRAEAQALRLLMEAPGYAVARRDLGKSCEHLVLSLRNKLGDGLITTIYGQGYALETSA